MFLDHFLLLGYDDGSYIVPRGYLAALLRSGIEVLELLLEILDRLLKLPFVLGILEDLAVNELLVLMNCLDDGLSEANVAVASFASGSVLTLQAFKHIVFGKTCYLRSPALVVLCPFEVVVHAPEEWSDVGGSEGDRQTQTAFYGHFIPCDRGRRVPRGESRKFARSY